MDKSVAFTAPEQCYIDGAWVDSASGARFDSLDPATGETLGSVPKLGEAETHQAIDAAEEAFLDWRNRPAPERGRLLRRFGELMGEHKEGLAHLLTREQGKPLGEARGEVDYAQSFLLWFAEEGLRLYGDVIPSHRKDARLLLLRQPVGVCGLITPWNFPYAMITRKLGAALAAGCTAVVKPAEQTPLCGLALARLAEEAGLPRGTVNVITGEAREIGKALMESDAVRKVSFTGSTEVGKLLIAQSAATVKKLSLELGGHAPFIVCADADVDAAVEGAIASKFRNSGQTCVCANRFYIHESLYDAFAEKFVAAIKSLKVGNGLDADTHLGPLIDMAAVEKSQRHVEDARDKGATILSGGASSSKGRQFFPPTLLGDADDSMQIMREETFGPVAPLLRFREEEEVVKLANDTPYGLAAYFYGRDIGSVLRLAEALEYGIVSVNSGVFSSERAPFGGVKHSGYGREGARVGIEEYTHVKYVMLGGIAT